MLTKFHEFSWFFYFYVLREIRHFFYFLPFLQKNRQNEMISSPNCKQRFTNLFMIFLVKIIGNLRTYKFHDFSWSFYFYVICIPFWHYLYKRYRQNEMISALRCLYVNKDSRISLKFSVKMKGYLRTCNVSPRNRNLDFFLFWVVKQWFVACKTF